MAGPERRETWFAGWHVEVWRDGSVIRLSVDRDQADVLGQHIGYTFTRGDPDCPDDFPDSDNLDDYLEWAKHHFG
jgi:hypothetical protein